MRYGKVFLVGAGPGAADLVTVRAVRCLQQADVLIYDRLVSLELLDFVPGNCKKIYVGKRKNLHVMSQDEINRELVRQARLGKVVVRLKGGDPFIFGRGGEEVDELARAGIAWEIVPGVTAASGAGASLGMPLTHRDEAQALTFVTAHRKSGQFDLDWSLVLHDRQTVAFYMALSCAADLVDELLARGKSPDTPFTIVANGTCSNEQYESCRLARSQSAVGTRTFSFAGPVGTWPKTEKRAAIVCTFSGSGWERTAACGGWPCGHLARIVLGLVSVSQVDAEAGTLFAGKSKLLVKTGHGMIVSPNLQIYLGTSKPG